jgi:hypothetical protein
MDTIKNPLDIDNSLESHEEIKNILTDGNLDNDMKVCNLLDKLSKSEQITNLRDVVGC